jgi:hypothetical protein
MGCTYAFSCRSCLAFDPLPSVQELFLMRERRTEGDVGTVFHKVLRRDVKRTVSAATSRTGQRIRLCRRVGHLDQEAQEEGP